MLAAREDDDDDDCLVDVNRQYQSPLDIVILIICGLYQLNRSNIHKRTETLKLKRTQADTSTNNSLTSVQAHQTFVIERLVSGRLYLLCLVGFIVCFTPKKKCRRGKELFGSGTHDSRYVRGSPQWNVLRGGARGVVVIIPCSRYRRRKWTRRHEFKSWTRLIAFHIALIPLGKVWIQLFSLQLWVNSRTD